MTQTDTYKKLKYMDRSSSVSITLVFKWHSLFNDGRTDSAQRGEETNLECG